jgi:hypothetical protein
MTSRLGQITQGQGQIFFPVQVTLPLLAPRVILAINAFQGTTAEEDGP